MLAAEAAAAPKGTLASEKCIEDITETSSIAEATATGSSLTEAVVLLSPFAIAKRLVGLGYFLEASLGNIVARIAIRVELPCQLTVRLFYLVRLSGAIDTK